MLAKTRRSALAALPPASPHALGPDWALKHLKLKGQQFNRGAVSQVSPQKPLGALPHQLRGFLSTWGVIQPRSDAFESCTACSYAIA